MPGTTSSAENFQVPQRWCTPNPSASSIVVLGHITGMAALLIKYGINQDFRFVCLLFGPPIFPILPILIQNSECKEKQLCLCSLDFLERILYLLPSNSYGNMPVYPHTELDPL